jgi:hypothetical protein
LQWFQSFEVGFWLGNDALENQVLGIAKDRCQHLTKIIYSFKKGANMFWKAFANHSEILTRLTALNLDRTLMTAQDASLIGMHASNLKELNLSSTGLSNNGFLCLFMPLDADGLPDSCYGKCTKLEILDIQNTKISIACAAKSYIHLKNTLKMFRTDNSIQVIEQCMSDPNHEIEEFRTDQLIIRSPGLFLDAVLAKAIILAPFATKVELQDIYCSDSEEQSGPSIKHLQKLSKLTSLSVMSSDKHSGLQFEAEFDHFFNHELLPVIKTHGLHLTTISLRFVQNLDLGLLVSNCVSVEKMSLVHNNFLNQTEKFEVVDNWPLTNLYINCKDFTNETILVTTSPSETVLKALLSGAHKVKELYLDTCSSLTDEAMTAISKVNKLNHLVGLSINGCHDISMATLLTTVLMNTNIPVHFIRITNCKGVSVVDCEQYEEYIRQQNINVRFRQKCYTIPAHVHEYFLAYF